MGPEKQRALFSWSERCVKIKSWGDLSMRGTQPTIAGGGHMDHMRSKAESL